MEGNDAWARMTQKSRSMEIPVLRNSSSVVMSNSQTAAQLQNPVRSSALPRPSPVIQVVPTQSAARVGGVQRPASQVVGLAAASPRGPRVIALDPSAAMSPRPQQPAPILGGGSGHYRPPAVSAVESIVDSYR